MKKTITRIAMISLVTLSLGATESVSAAPRRQMGNDPMNQRGSAGPDNEFGRGGLRQLVETLQLTEEQQQQIMTILVKSRLTRMEDWQDVQTPRQELFNMLLNEEYDEANVRQMIQQQIAERQQAREDRFVERAKMLAEIKAVFTPEQIEKVKHMGTDFFDRQPPNIRGRDDRQDRRDEPDSDRHDSGMRGHDPQNNRKFDKDDRNFARHGEGMRGHDLHGGPGFDKGGLVPDGEFPFMILSEVNLSDEQKQQIAEIFAAQQMKRFEQRQQTQNPERPLVDMLLSEDFNEQKVRELYQQQMNAAQESGQKPEELLEDRLVAQAKLLGDIKAVLTPEQRDAVKQNYAEWMENAGKQGGRFGHERPMKHGWF